MMRCTAVIILLVLVGLAVVYGEVEAVKIGYEVRQLNLKKLALTDDARKAECLIAGLTVPTRLEERLSNCQVKLARTTRLKVAKARPSPEGEQAGRRQMLLARLFEGSAQAQTR